MTRMPRSRAVAISSLTRSAWFSNLRRPVESEACGHFRPITAMNPSQVPPASSRLDRVYVHEDFAPTEVVNQAVIDETSMSSTVVPPVADKDPWLSNHPFAGYPPLRRPAWQSIPSLRQTGNHSGYWSPHRRCEYDLGSEVHLGYVGILPD